MPTHNILVIRLSSLGDIVLTSPVYKNLKAHWPDCRIAVLVKPQYLPILENNPCVDEVIPFYGLLSAVKLIRQKKFTHLLDLHSTLRSFLIRYFSGVPQTARYRKDALARRFFVRWRRPSPALAKHTIDRYLESLADWGVPTPTRGLNLGDYGSGGTAEMKPDRILVVQTAFLGDATLTLPLAREIKKVLPESRLTVLCRPDTAEVFHSSAWIDEIIVDDKHGAGGGMGDFLGLAQKIRKERFDLAIVPHRSFRSALLVWRASIPERIGFSSSAGRFLFTRTIPFTWGMHDLERNLGLLLPFQKISPLTPTLSPEGRGNIRLPLAPSEREANTDFSSPTSGRGESEGTAVDSVYLAPRASNNGSDKIAKRLAQESFKRDKPLIGLHPGSIWPTKRWPADRYSVLIRRLVQDAGAAVVLVGGPNDRELSASIAENSGVCALDWTGKTTLAELIDLMQHLSLFITNDSGPMHVATASGTPTLAIFGPTTRELGFFPYGGRHRVLEVDLTCRPCGLHGGKTCPEGHFLCMKLISVEEAYRTAVEMLRGQGSGARFAAPKNSTISSSPLTPDPLPRRHSI